MINRDFREVYGILHFSFININCTSDLEWKDL